MRATAQVVSPLRVCGGFRLSFCCCGGQLTVTVTVTAQVVRACNYAGSVRTDTALPSRAITTLPLRTKLPPPPRARTPPSLPSREHRPPLGLAHKHRALTLRKHHPSPTREHRPFIAQDLRPPFARNHRPANTKRERKAWRRRGRLDRASGMLRVAVRAAPGTPLQRDSAHCRYKLYLARTFALTVR